MKNADARSEILTEPTPHITLTAWAAVLQSGTSRPWEWRALPTGGCRLQELLGESYLCTAHRYMQFALLQS